MRFFGAGGLTLIGTFAADRTDSYLKTRADTP
jgi:hypothetical protein